MTTDHAAVAADDLDVLVPCSYRMGDYWTSGTASFAPDRFTAKAVEAAVPGTARAARAAADFEVRVLEYLAGAGIAQVLHLGHGYPYAPAVTGVLGWEVVQQHIPGAPVVMVCTNRRVYTLNEALVHADAPVVTLCRDRLGPEVLDDPQVRAVLDPDRPLAVLLTSVHRQHPAPDLPALVAGLTARMAPGSLLALSHLAAGGRRTRRWLTRSMRQATRGRWGRVLAPCDLAKLLLGMERVGSRPGDVAAWSADGRTPPPAAHLPTEGGRAPAVVEYGGLARIRT
ncbi:SAM-dependent methyltransferase [Kitasatospora sp. NPDC058046]|uniref:SAM-dependent methyltransferase n=1 Tax=Kitasatospora sp. NPDC058046 TaxID=3346312 RepID=UPI0036DC4890